MGRGAALRGSADADHRGSNRKRDRKPGSIMSHLPDRSGPDPSQGFAFLRTRWTHLVLANYPCHDHLLRPPPGLELDRFDSSAFVSLVGFSFLDTRVLGVGWPGFRHFPEWNLRFYVRRGDQRGVCFVRE